MKLSWTLAVATVIAVLGCAKTDIYRNAPLGDAGTDSDADSDADTGDPPDPDDDWFCDEVECEFAEAHAVAVDPDGNVFVAGSFACTECLLLGDEYQSYAGGPSDIVLAKLSTHGEHLWSRSMGGPAAEVPTSLAVDSEGDVYMTGWFRGTTEIGSTLQSAGKNDIFLAKFDGDGDHEWSESWGTSSDDDLGLGVAVDSEDDVVLVGSIAGAVSFGGGSIGGSGPDNAFVVKLSPSGDHVWSRAANGEVSQAQAVAVDHNDHVVFGGNLSWDTSFGGQTFDCGGVPCSYLAEYGADGAHLWSKIFDGQNSYIYALATDGANRIAAVGTSPADLDLGGGELPNPADVNNAFVGRFNGNGGHHWSHGYGGHAQDWGLAVAVDSEDRVVTGGWYQSQMYVHGELLESNGGADGFVIAHDADGQLAWCDGIGGEQGDRVNGLAVDGDDAVFAVGRLGDAMLLAKYAWSGDVLWTMTYGNAD